MATSTTSKKTTFDLRTEATRPLLAYVGVADLVAEYARTSLSRAQAFAADAQKSATQSLSSLDLSPKGAAEQANARLESLGDAVQKDVKARREALEKRVADLQAEAKALPGRANEVYSGLAERGGVLVKRVRNQESTKQAVAEVKKAETKAKTTVTQTKNAATAKAKSAGSSTSKSTAAKPAAKSTAAKPAAKSTVTKSAAKKPAAAKPAAKSTVTKPAAKKPAAAKPAAKSTVTKPAAKSTTAPAASSAKATATTVGRAGESAVTAVTEAAKKLGD